MSPELSLLLTILALLAAAAVFLPDKGLYARWRRARRQSSRVLMEDALKHLFTCELEDRHPTLQSLAGALSVNQNAAAELAAQLEIRELIRFENGEFLLTERGRDYALRIVRAHRLWERYLSEQTGYAETDWHTLAERYEHDLSPEQADAMASMLGNPSHDPHGDPIPTASGELGAVNGRPLAEVEAGQTVRIVHMEDEPAVIYSQLVAEGLHTGMVVRVLDRTPERIRFWAHGNEHILAPLLANNISVRPVSTEAPPPGIPLTRLEPGDSGEVVYLAPGIRGAERRRLMDLGLLPGTKITAELRSPSGDPTAYLVRGALIALREDQARHIKIKNNGNKA